MFILDISKITPGVVKDADTFFDNSDGTWGLGPKDGSLDDKELFIGLLVNGTSFDKLQGELDRYRAGDANNDGKWQC